MKREEEKERAFREERAKRDEEFLLGVGATEMCKEELRKVIDSDRRMYYRTEELNDKLYIHYKGWKDIRGLDGWTGLKAIYAECNAFSRISGLDTCTKLRSLFLQENCIRQISGLDHCRDLWSLNLSSNFIQRIEGLSNCKGLNTLIIAKNQIGVNGLDDLSELVGSELSSLDIQDNCISDPDVLPEVFMQMPGLRVLYLKGNPCAKKIPNYRKGCTANLLELRYLDDRPVFEEDRRAAEAFNRGGLEEERAEKRKIKDEKNAAHDKNMKAFSDMVVRVKLEKREREAMRLEDRYNDETDPGMEKERRAKQRLEEWKVANEDLLKDHDLERAKKILAAEREAAKEAAAESGEASQTDEAVEPPAAEVAAKVKPEDNRKLVYDDIWDDVPTASSSAKPRAAAPEAAAAQKAEVAAEDYSPATSFEGSRPGWFFGSAENGLGYYRDTKAKTPSMASADVLASSSTASPTAEAEGAPAAAAAQSDSWYSRYSSKLQEKQDTYASANASEKANIEGLKASTSATDGRALFAPPPRGRAAEPTAAAAAPAVPVEDSELQEMD